MTRPNELLHQLLAVAERIDGPEAWVHLCVTAAEEAYFAALQAEDKRVEKASTASHRAELIALRERLAATEAEYRDTRRTVGKLLLARQACPTCSQTDFDDGIEINASSWESAEQGAREAARVAYRNTLPPITSRRMVQCFVACVAAGVLRDFIPARDANTLLYAAQAALTAYPKRKPRKDARPN